MPGIKVGTAVSQGSLLTCKVPEVHPQGVPVPEPGLGKGQSWHGWQQMSRATGHPTPLSLGALPPLLLQAIIGALRAILQYDEETLHRALQELAGAIEAMSEALRRMHGESSWCLCVLQLITHAGVTAHHL